jgi:hypothetical protein
MQISLSTDCDYLFGHSDLKEKSFTFYKIFVIENIMSITIIVMLREVQTSPNISKLSRGDPPNSPQQEGPTRSRTYPHLDALRLGETFCFFSSLTD